MVFAAMARRTVSARFWLGPSPSQRSASRLGEAGGLPPVDARPLLPSVMGAIGNTPLVDLTRLVRNSGLRGRVVAKLENLNPGYSKKDRIAAKIVTDALSSGEIAPGDTVVELTSGNTGTGLAIACAVHGLQFVAVMSRGNSVERARMMAALGAEVVLVDQCPDAVPGQVSGADLARVEEVCRTIVERRAAFRADQFQLAGSFTAHYEHTAPEIWSQAGGQVDAFVDYVGSGGTFAGTAAYFKEVSDGRVKCFIVEPAAAVVLDNAAGARPQNGNHRIQGGGYSIALEDLPVLQRATPHVDGYTTITDDAAVRVARRLAAEEGVFGGFSGGANVAAALEILGSDWAREAEVPVTVAAIICDSGLKYLSTDLWE